MSASKSGRESPEARVSLWTILTRPEFTAIVGTIVVFAFFAIFTGNAGFLSLAMTRNYLEVAATIGIITITGGAMTGATTAAIGVS